MPPKGLFKRKSSRKRSYGKKRKYSRKSTFRRRVYSHKKRSFSRKRPYRGTRHGYKTMRWPVINRLPEHALRKMVTYHNAPTVWTFGDGGGGGVVSTSTTAPRDYFYIDLNNCYTPGSQNSATAVPIPAASGFTQMNDYYRQWHVLGCKVDVKCVVQTSGDGGGTGLGCQLEIGMAAMTSANNTASPTLDWDVWKRQRYFKKKDIVFGRSNSIVEQAHISMYVRPDEIEGLTGATTDFAGALYYGTGTTPPTTKPTMWIMIFGLTPQSNPIQYVLYFSLTYYVKWISPKMTPELSLDVPVELKGPPPMPLVEGKEEKKFPDAEADEKEFEEMNAGLDEFDVEESSLRRALATAKCNNPSHPKIAHERKTTCSFTLSL